jgi:hypothetical protein
MRRSAISLLSALLVMTAVPATQSPDTAEPRVQITSPGDDQVLSGTVEITVTASDASGVAGVIFEVDGQAIAPEDLDEPWSAFWNTGASGPGSHILTVIARDTVGNAVRSAVVPVVVGAGAPPPPPPPPSNHSPTAAPDSLTSVERAPVTFTGASLLANDTDEDGHAVSLSNVAEASSEGGSIVSVGGGSYKYTPAPTFAGLDTFTYTIVDGFGGTATGTVTVNVTAPSDEALVLALGFDENMGLTAFDGSGRNYHGTISGAERVSGKIGGALRFDGVDDWVTVADAPGLDLSSGMTLEAWVNPSAVGGWNTVLLKEGAGNMAYELYANIDAARPAAYFTTPGGAIRAITGTAALAANTWTHIAATYDGANMRFYVNGSLVRTVARAGAILGTDGPLHIGGNEVWGGEWFSGLLDEVRVYNRALSASEIQADMSGATLPNPPANHAPVAQNDSLTTVADAPVSFTAAALLANDSDANSDPITITSMAVASVAGGTVSTSGDQAWTYTPQASYTGTDSFTYVIEDGRGGAASGTVKVTVSAPAPPPPPPSSGLVLALGFNEAAGATTTSDASGHGHTGAVREAQFVSGKFGNALSFDGVNDWVAVADSASLDLSSAMTMEAWVQPSVVAGWQTVMLKEGAGTMAYELYGNNDVNRPAAYFTTAGGALRAATGTAKLAANTWTHIAATYDGTNMKLYVNGVLVRNVLRAGAILTTDGPLHIGGNEVWGGEWFSGLIDEVRIYNRALSIEEIQADMTTPVP